MVLIKSIQTNSRAYTHAHICLKSTKPLNKEQFSILQDHKNNPYGQIKNPRIIPGSDQESNNNSRARPRISQQYVEFLYMTSKTPITQYIYYIFSASLNIFSTFFQKITQLEQSGNPGKSREMAVKTRENSWVLRVQFFDMNLSGFCGLTQEIHGRMCAWRCSRSGATCLRRKRDGKAELFQ